MKRLLAPCEIIDYINTNTIVLLTKPDKSRHEVLAADCAFGHYSFNVGRLKSVLLIECSSIDDLYGENGDIYFQTKDGIWELHAEEEVFDFSPSNKEMLKPHEITACVKRAGKLEAFLNDRLCIFKLDSARVYVDFKINVESHYEQRRCGPIEPPSEPTYEYYFDVYIGNLNDEEIYIKDMVTEIDISNDEALRMFARDLLKKLLPPDVKLFLDAHMEYEAKNGKAIGIASVGDGARRE